MSMELLALQSFNRDGRGPVCQAPGLGDLVGFRGPRSLRLTEKVWKKGILAEPRGARLPSTSGQTFHTSRPVSSFVKRGVRGRGVCAAGRSARQNHHPGSIPAAPLTKPLSCCVAAQGFKNGSWGLDCKGRVAVCTCRGMGVQTPGSCITQPAGRLPLSGPRFLLP